MAESPNLLLVRSRMKRVCINHELYAADYPFLKAKYEKLINAMETFEDLMEFWLLLEEDDMVDDFDMWQFIV